MNTLRLRPALVVTLMTALVLLAVLRSHLGTRLDSFTIDEPWHAVAGAAYPRQGDFALNPEHPPLVKLWAGAFLGGDFQVPTAPPLQDKDSERLFVEGVMYRDNDDRAAQSRLRLAMWLLNGGLMLGVGLLLWRSLGAAWALGSLACIAIEPSVGAYLPVVMTDLPVALGLLAAAIALGLLLAGWRWPQALLLGLTLGIALSSKHSALPGLAGLAAFAALAWAWQARQAALRENLRRAAQLALAGLIAVGLLWAQYGLRFEARIGEDEGFNRPLAAKLDDIRAPLPRELIRFAAGARLLPESYLWGLADTVRVGLEGRGEAGVLLWGRHHEGRPPRQTWPSYIASKLPLPLMALVLTGAFLLWRLPLDPRARWTLAALGAMALGFGASLFSAQSAYAGVRHAMPLVLALLVLAGAVFAWAAAGDRRWLALPLAASLMTAIGTLREARLWEFHNALAGGSERGYVYFDHESVELGQRLHEIEAFVRSEVMPRGGTLYLDYWAYAPPAWIEARSLPIRKRVESIHDENPEGHYAGWFLKRTAAREPGPAWGWDPVEGLAGLEAVERLGNVEIWQGEQRQPARQTWQVFSAISRYVYAEGGEDWDLVSRRAGQILAHSPGMYFARIELANARLRLGDAEGARQAFAAMLDQTKPPLPPALREAVEERHRRLVSGEPAASVPILRNPMLE